MFLYVFVLLHTTVRRADGVGQTGEPHCMHFLIADRRESTRHSIVTRSKKMTENSPPALSMSKNAPPRSEGQPPAPPPAPAPAPAPATVDEKKRDKPRPEKQYQCVKCGRRYNARRNLVRHMTLECGIDPRYKCPHCGYTKHRRNELKRHIQKKHAALAEATNAAVATLTVT